MSQNLIPFHLRTEEEQRIIRSKGGMSRSPLKSISAKLHFMKKRGMNDENIQWLHDMMVSNEAASFEIIKFLRLMQEQAKTTQERAIVVKLLLEWQKQWHGVREAKHEVTITNQLPIADRVIDSIMVKYSKQANIPIKSLEEP